jgi:hypothetical protein
VYAYFSYSGTVSRLRERSLFGEQSKKSRKSNQASTKPPKDELPNGAESHGNKKRKTIAG